MSDNDAPEGVDVEPTQDSNAGDVTDAPTEVKPEAVSEESAITEPELDSAVEPIDDAETVEPEMTNAAPTDEPADEPASVDEPASDEAEVAAITDEPVATDEPVVAESPDAAEESAPDDEVEPALSDVGGEDELFDEDAPAPRPKSAFDRPGRWYVVHTQSGHEKKAQQNLAARTESMNMEDRIFESVIPMEDVVEFKNGKKVVVQKKMFPGYLLVRAHLDDDAWYVVRNTPSVVNFVGSGGKPSPLLRREVENFLAVPEEGAPAAPNKRQTARLEYEMGETVRVKEGPFADFSGEIVEINADQLKVKVLVNIFGRETPVELEFSQIARL